jgi:environmental stress-induced protein Ves
MVWKLITADSLPSMPWKNGGGTTREVLKFPVSATIDTFDWRISLAAVATSGPFSIFPEIDRTMIVTDGQGIELHDKNERIAVRRSDEPFSFAGEIPYRASLIGGPIADLNVMTRRTRYSHLARRHRTAGTSIDRGSIRVIVALSDRLICVLGMESVALARLDSLFVHGTESVAVETSDWLEVEIARLQPAPSAAATW